MRVEHGGERDALSGWRRPAVARGGRRVLAVLTRTVWIANAVNVAVVWFFISRGALF